MDPQQVAYHAWQRFWGLAISPFQRESKLLVVRGAENLKRSHAGERTIFLGNHTSVLDPIPHHRAIWNNVRALNHKSIYRQYVLSSVATDDFYLGEPYKGVKGGAQKLIGRAIRMILNATGGILIKRTPVRDSDLLTPGEADRNLQPLNPKRRRGAARQYLDALLAGRDLLIYPWANISHDGTIDYAVGHPTFKPVHLNQMATLYHRRSPDSAPDLGVQFLHHTKDILSDRTILSFGSRHPLSDDVPALLNFREEVRKCTTITPYQLFAAYTEALADQNLHPITLDDQQLGGDLEQLMQYLEREGFAVIREDHGADLARSMVEFYARQRVEGPRYTITIQGQKHPIDTIAYQANTIAHCDVDLLFQELAEARRDQVTIESKSSVEATVYK